MNELPTTQQSSEEITALIRETFQETDQIFADQPVFDSLTYLRTLYLNFFDKWERNNGSPNMLLRFAIYSCIDIDAKSRHIPIKEGIDHLIGANIGELLQFRQGKEAIQKYYHEYTKETLK